MLLLSVRTSIHHEMAGLPWPSQLTDYMAICKLCKVMAMDRYSTDDNYNDVATEANNQSSIHCAFMSTDVKCHHSQRYDRDPCHGRH